MAESGLKKFFGWLVSVAVKSLTPKRREALKEMLRLEREHAILKTQMISCRAFHSPKLAEAQAKIKANRERYEELRKMFSGDYASRSNGGAR
ncbi:MAG: hypothetical protein AAB731_01340 [Patescibacteria group bacterium]